MYPTTWRRRTSTCLVVLDATTTDFFRKQERKERFSPKSRYQIQARNEIQFSRRVTKQRGNV